LAECKVKLRCDKLEYLNAYNVFDVGDISDVSAVHYAYSFRIELSKGLCAHEYIEHSSKYSPGNGAILVLRFKRIDIELSHHISPEDGG
jgi:hypothetical protein